MTNGLNSGFYSVLVPVYGARVLHSPITVGAIFAASGVALILGALVFSWIGLGWPRLPVLAICYLLVCGPRMVVFLLTSNELVLIVLSGLLTFAFGPLNPILGAVKAERVPEAFRARVFGAISAFAMACMPAGSLLAGLLLDGVGLSASIAVFSAVSLLMSLCPMVFPAWRGVAAPTVAEAGPEPAARSDS